MRNMKGKRTILVFFSAVLKLVTSQYDACYPNEIFTPSVNPCNTCDIRDYCPDFSSPGCDCVPGLLRDSQGACVPLEACYSPYGPYNRYGPNNNYNNRVPPVIKCTGEYEEFKSCGSSCPPACQTSSRPCTEQCVPGCYCTEGYIRNKRGVCVRPDQCESSYAVPKPRCGSNEEYSDCGPCTPTCENRNPFCTLQCVKGCFCRSGYVRKGGMCVLPRECDNIRPVTTEPTLPLQCGTNEVFSNCGTACPPTCANPGPQSCTEQCVRGCFCRRGYVRWNGRCVLPRECDNTQSYETEQRCGMNEVFDDCRTACPPTCENPRPQACTLQCVRGCFCRRGYLRWNRRCVLPQECPPVRTTGPPPTYPSPPSVLPRRGSYIYPSPATVPPVIVTTAPPYYTSPAPDSRGCSNRFLCNKFCREERRGQIGFCVGRSFTNCQCHG